MKELLEREGLTAEGGPWGWLASELLAGPAARGGGAGSRRTGNLVGIWEAEGPAQQCPSVLSPHYPHGSFPGKIEIKIVRPGAEGTEEDARWLTDEDTRNLKEIFFNILVRGSLVPSPGAPGLHPALVQWSGEHGQGHPDQPQPHHLLSCGNFWQLDGYSLAKCGCQVPALPTWPVPGCSSALQPLTTHPPRRCREQRRRRKSGNGRRSWRAITAGCGALEVGRAQETWRSLTSETTSAIGWPGSPEPA